MDNRSHARRRLRFGTALLATAVLAVSACSSDDDSDNSEPTPDDSPAAVDLPDSPAGQQLQWLLDELVSLPVSDEDAEEHFSAEFLDEVSIEELNPQLEYITEVVVTGILEDAPESLLVEGDVGGEGINIAIEVDDDERIETLLFLPPEDHALPSQPTDWEEVDARIDDVAPNGAFLAARIDDNGECEPIHTNANSDPIAVGSVFKLFVLQAIAASVESGDIAWDDTVEITNEMKSLPTGELQDRPEGDEVSVMEASQLMISVSDNTATDLLIDLVGRTAVEDQIATISENQDLALPLMDTRTFFDLKLNNYPDELERYLALSESEKSTYLDDFAELGTPSDDDLEAWTSQPRSIDDLEWFFSPDDICAVYAELDQWDDSEVEQAMSVHDGGLEIANEDWDNVWFKGGSEPGVYALSHLGKHVEGDRYVVAIMVNNPDEVFQETEVELEMFSLTSGALRIAADS